MLHNADINPSGVTLPRHPEASSPPHDPARRRDADHHESVALLRQRPQNLGLRSRSSLRGGWGLADARAPTTSRTWDSKSQTRFAGVGYPARVLNRSAACASLKQPRLTI